MAVLAIRPCFRVCRYYMSYMFFEGITNIIRLTVTDETPVVIGILSSRSGGSMARFFCMRRDRGIRLGKKAPSIISMNIRASILKVTIVTCRLLRRLYHIQMSVLLSPDPVAENMTLPGVHPLNRHTVHRDPDLNWRYGTGCSGPKQQRPRAGIRLNSANVGSSLCHGSARHDSAINRTRASAFSIGLLRKLGMHHGLAVLVF